MIYKTLFLSLFSSCFFVINTNTMEANDIEQKVDKTITFVEKTLKEFRLEKKDRKYNYSEQDINELIGHSLSFLTLNPITPMFDSLDLNTDENILRKKLNKKSDALVSGIEAFFLIKKMQQNNPTFCEKQYNLIKEFINSSLENLEILQNAAFFAAKRNTYFCLAFLLQIGIDPNLKDWYKQSLLQIAAQNGKNESVTLLTKINGIEIDSKDNYGATPLQKALKYFEIKTALTLSFNGANHFPHNP